VLTDGQYFAVLTGWS